jgi:hypothetical protein
MPIHQAHILTYLRLSGRRIGLLLNFNAVLLGDGLRRLVNAAGVTETGRSVLFQ